MKIQKFITNRDYWNFLEKYFNDYIPNNKDDNLKCNLYGYIDDENKIYKILTKEEAIKILKRNKEE